MSLPAIRSALETALNSITPPVATAWENVQFSPTPGVAYQQPFLLPATPANLEMGPGFTEQGIFQVNGYFPKDAGTYAAINWAEGIRAKFPYAASFPLNGGGTVNVSGTPEIGPGRADGDRHMVPCKVRWLARINGG